ncbi:DUF202 domain-containing protein [Pseudonocardia abyssalis]|uniref:DUF202 domain-containing protein n=1 Tax=Pseudonocardia abyssalis TaxID=2792008 RepID=A0ABS6ULN6_9PSEU|nr:DUF202 domain-containing protein [Pseudonocardia abyssalis]MBW0117896.1 DUF202 domain-containing protein [Pseudonocardia abyssalis]MBW0133155.1 DUF202 domain-containing protein [Pseudonocardia abyssalis]
MVVAAAAGERTALAWQRTGWTALGAGALVLHAAPGGPGAVAGVMLLVSGVLCSAVVAPSRMRRLRAASMTGRAVAVPAVVATVTAVVVLVGVLAVTTMLLPAAR